LPFFRYNIYKSCEEPVLQPAKETEPIAIEVEVTLPIDAVFGFSIGVAIQDVVWMPSVAFVFNLISDFPQPKSAE